MEGPGSPAPVRGAVNRGTEVVPGDRVNGTITHMHTGARQEVQVKATRGLCLFHTIVFYLHSKYMGK